MSLKSKSITGLFWSFAENFGLRIVSISTFFFLAGMLSARDFGLMALANTYIIFINIFVSQGFTGAIVQRKDVTEKHLSSAFWGNVVIHLVFFFLSFFSAPLVASIYTSPELIPIIRVLSLSFIISAVGKIHYSIHQRKFHFKILAIANLGGILAGSIIGIGAALYGLGIWSLVYQSLAQIFIGNIIYWVKSDWSPKWIFSVTDAKEILVFGTKLMMNNIVQFTNRYADDLIIGYFFGMQSLGYYSFAYKIYNTVIDVVLLPVSRVMLPLFSSLQDDKGKFIYTYLTMSKVNGYLSLLAFIGLGFVIPDAILLIYGTKWVPSTPFIQIFSLGGLFLFIYVLTEQSLISLGQVKQSILINLALGVSNVGIILFLIRYGMEAVAYTYLIRSVVLLPLLLFIIRKYVGIPSITLGMTLAKPYLTALICVLLLWVTVFVFKGQFAWQLGLKVMVMGITFLLTIFVFETHLIKQLLSTKRPVVKAS
jgi:PST family polysaccharide transporter